MNISPERCRRSPRNTSATGRSPRAIKLQLKATGSAAAKAYASMGQFLASTYDLNETTDRYAAGEAEYTWRVANCLRDSRSPAELYEYGAGQVAEYEGKIFRVAEEVSKQANLGLTFGTDAEQRASVRAVMDHLAADSPKDDTELFAWYREAGARAVEYGRQQQMFDIPDGLPAGRHRDAAGAAQQHRRVVLPCPAVQDDRRRSLLPDAHRQRPRRAQAQQPQLRWQPPPLHEGFPGHDWHYKYMTQHAAEIADIRWLHARCRRGLLLDVGRLDGVGRMGALLGRVDGRGVVGASATASTSRGNTSTCCRRS